jgi:iron complex outermembrane receptor protein
VFERQERDIRSDGAVRLVFGRYAILGSVLFFLFLASQGAHGQATQPDLTKVNLEDLMNIEVTSVAKKEQRLSRTAAAVFVITQNDIQHSSATNIPDLLRMVPGVDVAQINASKWAISIRGFNGQYSNKLLVLIDGRTVYSPLLSGVFWDAQDVPLENIDRIEVIRGPGATVWGANAVDGVISVITKKASDTQGGLLTQGVGTSDQAGGIARYGGKFGSNAAYRVFADGFAYNHFPDVAGRNGNDGWNIVQGGFRVDANASAQDSITVEGDAHSGNAGEMVSSVVSIFPPVNGALPFNDRFSGWNLEKSRMSLITVRRQSAVSPSISGIWISISTRSKVCWASNERTSCPLLATTAEWPIFPKMRTATVWLTWLSSATRIYRPSTGDQEDSRG